MRLRRFLAVAAFSLWFGGLTFYALVVIPTAHDVLRSHLRVGFITQGVTQWINAAGAAALAALLWDLLASTGEGPRRLRVFSWVLLAAAQVSLFALHPILDGHLDAASREIAEPERFYEIHRIYLLVTTVQWGAGLLHLWTLLKGRAAL